MGKTTSIRHFARKHYQHFVEINFEQTPAARRAFEGNLDARTLISNLSIMGFGPFIPGKTLVFFDEIQSCPQARTAIKFLVEDGKMDYIESGSLLGINYREVSSYPVGFEHQINMYPLDFEEFLWAFGIEEDVIGTLRDAFIGHHPVPEFLHQQVMERFAQFMIVGGMPAVVSTFKESPDFHFTLQTQRDIITSYRDDISKYAGRDKLSAKSVFDTIPQQLSKQNKRYILAQIEKNASMRKYSSPTQWLADAGIAYLINNVSALEQPLAAFAKPNMFKIYLHDTGLLCNMFMNGIQEAILHHELSVNEGSIAENYVAAELVKHGHHPYYYDRKSRQELDFVFDTPTGIGIIEVKSGKDYQRHTSLDTAINDLSSAQFHAYVLAPCNVQQDNKITYLPLYMAMFI